MAAFELVIAGFGGQGVLFLGEVLARAAVLEGRNVTWMPSYGPEQRGGTAMCTVVVSDDAIGSPVVSDPQVAIVMNRPSLDRFEPRVRPGGLLIVNISMVDRPVQRTDVRVLRVAATHEAAALGAPQAANMVMLGALLAVMPILPPGAVRRALDEVFLPDRRAMLEVNTSALERGARAALEPA